MSRNRNGSRRAGVITIGRTHEVPVVMLDGCAATSVEFTVLQLARHAPLIDALAAADAALRVPRFGSAVPLTTKERLPAEHERLLPYPRSRRADAVLRRATHLADSVFESGSRLLIEELGFEAPELQHELWLPELGKRAFLDFYWPGVDVGAEADGRGKYRGEGSVGTRGKQSATAAGSSTDAAETAASVAAAVVISEKDRENAIRRQVRGFDRWDWAEFRRKQPVEARLQALGVPRVRRATILIT